MKVSFVKVQKFITDKIESYKVFYLVDNTNPEMDLTMDDGTNAKMSIFGSKQMEMKTGVEGFNAIRMAFESKKIKCGDLVDLRIEPNPQNPSFNICTGINFN